MEAYFPHSESVDSLNSSLRKHLLLFFCSRFYLYVTVQDATWKTLWCVFGYLYGATGTVLCNLETLTNRSQGPLTKVLYFDPPVEPYHNDSPQKEPTTSAQGIQTRVVLAFEIMVGFRSTGEQLLKNPKTLC